MYIPRSYQEDDLAKLHDMMRTHNFATAFTQSDGVPCATHLPMLIDATRGEFGTLVMHMARANPHWKAWDDSTTALVVFQGPHDYISPSMYANPEAVPTWNYAAIHAYGTPTVIHETALLRELVGGLTGYHEAGRNPQWDIQHAEPLMESNLKAIVGIEIPIERLEGKYKFNQNRSAEDQQGVVTALAESNPAVAEIMRRNLAGGD
jgi:transcriptional regulator